MKHYFVNKRANDSPCRSNLDCHRASSSIGTTGATVVGQADVGSAAIATLRRSAQMRSASISS